MSRVTNVILTWSIMEDDNVIGEINEVVRQANDRGQRFVSCKDPSLPDGWYGGSKMLETNIAIAAFNYFGPSEVIDALTLVKWQEPENVRVMICDQDDLAFTMHELPKRTIIVDHESPQALPEVQP